MFDDDWFLRYFQRQTSQYERMYGGGQRGKKYSWWPQEEDARTNTMKAKQTIHLNPEAVWKPQFTEHDVVLIGSSGPHSFVRDSIKLVCTVIDVEVVVPGPILEQAAHFTNHYSDDSRRIQAFAKMVYQMMIEKNLFPYPIETLQSPTK